MSPSNRVLEDPESTVAKLIDEGLESLGAALRSCGVEVSVWTAIRWCRSGRLEGIKVGGSWRTSRAAVLRMVAADTERARRGAGTRKSSVARRRQRVAARRYLESLGVPPKERS